MHVENYHGFGKNVITSCGYDDYTIDPADVERCALTLADQKI